jgi:hypothetical protein
MAQQSTGKPGSELLTPIPAISVSPAANESPVANSDKNDSGNAASETKKKLHWLEIGYFSSQIRLVAIGIWALTIEHGRQSGEMQK